MLSELAEASPVLLVLEDLHWADRSTRDLVTFLSRVLHRERLAIVVTYRTDDMHRRHPLRPVIAELTRLPSVTTVALGPLGASAMAEHLTSLSGQPLDAATLDSLITRAEGNAYYAEELLAASSAGGELPAGLADLLLARTERLSPAAQQVLRAAAVTGRRVDDELARQASGLAGPEYDDAVREAVAHQLLVPDGEQGYAFRHALLREAIYGDLLPGERTRLHGRLAELLADERRLAEVPGTAAELAHHSLASHDIPRGVRRVGGRRAGSGPAGGAGRGAPALRPGAFAVGAGGGAGEAERDGPRQARVPLRQQRGRQRRHLPGRAAAAPPDRATSATAARRPGAVLPGQRAALVFPARPRRGRRRHRRGRGRGRRAAGGAAALGAGPRPGDLRARAAVDEGRRARPGPRRSGPWPPPARPRRPGSRRTPW